MAHIIKNYKNYKDFYIYVELAKKNHSTMNLMITSPQVIPFGVSLYLFFWGSLLKKKNTGSHYVVQNSRCFLASVSQVLGLQTCIMHHYTRLSKHIIIQKFMNMPTKIKACQLNVVTHACILSILDAAKRKILNLRSV